MHRALEQHGAVALAALLGLVEEGREITPQALAGRIDTEASPAGMEHLEQRLHEAASRAGIPDRMGVFIEPSDCAFRAGSVPLDALASLAVLAHRTGPLYVPSRAIEPSLLVLAPSVLVFPEELR